ncbi:MAG: ABC transporter ATP-binding protein [Beijerinckiaceae bacterium]
MSSTRAHGADAMTVLAISDLHLMMTSYDGEAHVLNGVDLTVNKGEIWGLVGETGCGKTLTGLSISRLLAQPPARYHSGSIRFDGIDILQQDEAAMRQLRGRRIGMIFQDPTTNLNPSFRVVDQLMDVAMHAGRISPHILGVTAAASRSVRRKAARQLAISMLEKVGIANAAQRADDYPHQFSGGMRQRVLIAMALIGQPDLLIADEPTTALDVSVQAQILQLLKALVTENQTAVLLITHNLGVVADTCSHVAVMYAGNIVESGTRDSVFRQRQHPYTRALLASIPHIHARRGALHGIAGTVPSLLNPPPGCRFAPRCPRADQRCVSAFPPALGGLDHAVSCYYPHRDHG